MPIRHSASFLQTFHTAQTAAQRTAESQTATPTDHMDVDPAALAFVKSGGAAPVIKTAPRAELPNVEVKVWDRVERRERIYHVAEGAQFATAKQAKWMLSIAINQVIPAGATLESLLIRLQQGFARHAASQFITNYKDLPMREDAARVTGMSGGPVRVTAEMAEAIAPGASTQELEADAETLPERKDKAGKPLPQYYAVPIGETIKFFRIKAGRKPGFYFIDVQASDEFHEIRNYSTKDEIIKAILEFGPEEAMESYGQLIGRCGRCRRTLTDKTSRDLGIGPECRKK